MDEIEKAIKRAAAVADAGPQGFREATYAAVLRHLLRASASSDTPGANLEAEIAKKGAPPKGGKDLPEPGEVADSGDRKMQVVWAVVALTQEGHEADNKSIREKIEFSLAVTPESGQNTNRTLRSLVPRYLTRRKKDEGSGYSYVPAARALEIFDWAENGADD